MAKHISLEETDVGESSTLVDVSCDDHNHTEEAKDDYGSLQVYTSIKKSNCCRFFNRHIMSIVYACSFESY